MRSADAEAVAPPALPAAGAHATAAGGVASLVGTAQYVAAQLVVAGAWYPPYSWRTNRIGDLGVTRCGLLVTGEDRYVCSPLHTVMNVSFVVGGVLTIVGAALLSRTWSPGRIARLAIVLWAVSALGKLIVGLAPADRWPFWNAVGALNVPVGAVAIMLTSAAIRDGHPRVAAAGAFLASVSIVAVVLTALSGRDNSSLLMGVGKGGMERLADLPGVLWVFIVGVVAVGSVRGTPHVA